MLSGQVAAAPDGAHSFDCNVKLGQKAIKKLKEAGFVFAIRYIGRKANPASNDLDADEAEKILDGGLDLMAVQHVEREPWEPSETKARPTARMPLRTRRRSASRPASTYADLTSPARSVPTPSSKYCNAWFKAVSDAGYVPGIYVGANAGLTGDQLYWQLRTKHYWKSGSDVPDIPQRGYCMVQRIKAGDQIGRVSNSRDLTVTDKFGNTPTWLSRSTETEGDVPEEVPTAMLAAVPAAGGDEFPGDRHSPVITGSGPDASLQRRSPLRYAADDRRHPRGWPSLERATPGRAHQHWRHQQQAAARTRPCLASEGN